MNLNLQPTETAWKKVGNKEVQDHRSGSIKRLRRKES
jgi:hypothetical protein